MRLHARLADYSELGNNDSWFGSNPHMPPTLKWVYFQDKPMSFVGQINLANLPDFESRTLLPQSGVLYFFSAYGWGDKIPWDYETTDELSKVIYWDGETSHLKTTYSDHYVEKFTQTVIEFQPILTLPDYQDQERPELRPFDFDSEEYRRYELSWLLREVYSDYYFNHSPHQMLGYPKVEQNSFREPDEILLLQVGSDVSLDSSQFEWGDGGRIYFLIREEDLRNRDFDKVRSWFESG